MLCHKCGRIGVLDERGLCASCYDKETSYPPSYYRLLEIQRSRRLQGLCIICGEVSEGKRFCNIHSLRQRLYDRRYYTKKRDKFLGSRLADLRLSIVEVLRPYCGSKSESVSEIILKEVQNKVWRF